MAGFLSGLSRLLVPVGEVAGSALSQQGALTDAERKRQAQQKALADLASGMGPEYSKLGPALAAGVDPSTAIGLIQNVQKQNRQAAFQKDFAAAGGVWTPQLATQAFAAGVIPAQAYAKLVSGGHSADVSMLDQMIANEPDPKKKALMESMRGSVGEEGSVVLPRVKNFETALGAGGVKPQIRKVDTGTTSYYEGLDPTTGAVLWSSTPTPGKAPATVIQADLDARKTAGILRAIPGLLSQIPPDRNKMVQQYWLYSVNPTERFGLEKIYGPVDSKYAALFSQLGQAQAGLSRSYMGGRPAQQLFERLSSHMPQPGDPPELVADKILSLGGPNGVLNQEQAVVQQAYGIPAEAPAANSMTPPKPPFAYSDIRVAPDGGYLVKDKGGRVFYYDTTAGTWLPTH